MWTATGNELAARRLLVPDGVAARRPAALPPQADPIELARQLARARAASERTRSRRAVRVADAFRLVQHERSVAATRRAWALLRAHGLDATDHQPDRHLPAGPHQDIFMLGILANVAGLEFGNISRRTLSGHARMARDGNTPAAGTAATKRGPVRTLDLRISPL